MHTVLLVIEGIGWFLAFALAILVVYVYTASYRPRLIEKVRVIGPNEGRTLPKNRVVKIMTWNIQFFAGRGYVFFFDLPKGKQKRITVDEKDLRKSFKRCIEIIKAEDPDIIMMQEVDVRSARSRHHDQEREIAQALKTFPYRVSAFYNKSYFTPHAMVLGSWNMEVAIFSKYKIESAFRYQLSKIPMTWIVQLFYLKRCVLEARVAMQGGGYLSVMTTHLDAYAQGNDIMQRQVNEVDALLAERTAAKVPWVIGGDFNLLPNAEARKSLVPDQRELYAKKSEIETLMKKYQVVPTAAELKGEGRAKWFTHAPDRPDLFELDRTLDYLFYSDLLEAKSHKVRSRDVQDISDHMPLIAEFKVKG
ncbi:MAG: endonuclease/exonuclease/phosphatase family protein [Patescibacteria group bacterium]